MPAVRRGSFLVVYVDAFAFEDNRPRFVAASGNSYLLVINLPRMIEPPCKAAQAQRLTQSHASEQNLPSSMRQKSPRSSFRSNTEVSPALSRGRERSFGTGYGGKEHEGAASPY